MRRVVHHVNRHKHHYGAAVTSFIVAGGIMSLVVAPWTGDESATAQTDERYTEQIQALERELTQSREEIEQLAERAEELEATIESFRVQERQLEQLIEQSELERDALQQEIEATEAEIDQHFDAIEFILVELYVDNLRTPLELLAGSASIGDYLDKQEYRTSVRDQLQSTIRRIQDLQRELEAERAVVEDTIEEQEGQRRQLAAKRQEQQRLLEVTQGQQELYDRILNRLEDERNATEDALSRLNSSDNGENGQPIQLASEGPVETGDPIGRVGSTGFSTGPHLHFEVRRGSSAVNPNSYLTRDNWVRPTGGPVSQSYGNQNPWYSSGTHSGTDYAPAPGTRIVAARDGVLYRGCGADLVGSNAYGYMALIDHGDNVWTVYGHMQAPRGESCDFNLSPT